MATGRRDEAQRKRAEARERRRKQSGDERNDKAAGHSADGDSTDEEPLAAVKQAAKVAAAGAAVGAAAAAARVLAKHEEGEEEHEHADDAPAEAAQPQAHVDEQQREREQEPVPENAPEPQPAAGTDDRGRPEPREDRPPGASPNEVGDAVRQAREQLESLLGRSPESVSAMERTHDGWLVTVEVLEVARVPESTDVLASYEIELDNDRNLRRYARVRRYHRSQADQGGGQ